MPIVEMLMPRMGESIMEGNILKWLKNEGDTVNEDESLVEIATDKVDTEIPSPYTGIVKKIFAQEGETVEVGKPIASIEIKGSEERRSASPVETKISDPQPEVPKTIDNQSKNQTVELLDQPIANRFYSPLVLNIAQKENLSIDLLNKIKGSGKDGRLTKTDLLAYIENKQSFVSEIPKIINETTADTSHLRPTSIDNSPYVSKPAVSFGGKFEIQEMDRMRKIISERMLESQKISAHVTSFVEADVTNLILWRHKHKQHFKDVEDTILTVTPLFIEAVAKAIKDYPLINSSVDGNNIIVKKDINIGMAVALPSGNLIVPVIKNADQLNIVGLTKKVNELAKKARYNKLMPDDLKDGTYSVSNMGSFGNLMGTPIINQPQVGILALGAVIKKPAVIETPTGDAIGIRHMMFLSHSYDHRIIDGALGGMFVRRVADYLEKFDINRIF